MRRLPADYRSTPATASRRWPRRSQRPRQGPHSRSYTPRAVSWRTARSRSLREGRSWFGARRSSQVTSRARNQTVLWTRTAGSIPETSENWTRTAIYGSEDAWKPLHLGRRKRPTRGDRGDPLSLGESRRGRSRARARRGVRGEARRLRPDGSWGAGGARARARAGLAAVQDLHLLLPVARGSTTRHKG